MALKFSVAQAAEMLVSGPAGESPIIDVHQLAVVELGCGLAFPSIAAAASGGARVSVATDYPDDFLKRNVLHNAGASN